MTVPAPDSCTLCGPCAAQAGAFLAPTACEREVERLMEKARRDYRVALDKLAEL